MLDIKGQKSQPFKRNVLREQYFYASKSCPICR